MLSIYALISLNTILNNGAAHSRKTLRRVKNGITSLPFRVVIATFLKNSYLYILVYNNGRNSVKRVLLLLAALKSSDIHTFFK